MCVVPARCIYNQYAPWQVLAHAAGGVQHNVTACIAMLQQEYSVRQKTRSDEFLGGEEIKAQCDHFVIVSC